MVARRRTNPEVTGGARSPARTIEERENQIINAAMDLAETQLRTGEASSQVVVHYLKLGSSRERLEQKRLEQEVFLLQTKREVMESEKRTEALVQGALEAFRIYSGNAPELEQPEYDEYE